MSPRAGIATIDFHVTAECSQECPYCWGPQGFENPVDTEEATEIVRHVRNVGAHRIVFTGGDPLSRTDMAALIRHAKDVGLEVALSTTGDKLEPSLLRDVAGCLDLISLPLDGSTEDISSRTKKPEHHKAVMLALELLRDHPSIDVKVCTPVTRHNLDDVINIVALVERYAETTEARVFYNVFQAFPRSMMEEVAWNELLVSDQEFLALKERLERPLSIHVNFLDRNTLDRLYAMVFPDGSLVIPHGGEYRAYGRFLDVDDFDAVLHRADFAADRHLEHSRGWSKERR